jgi:hypothetical protein
MIEVRGAQNFKQHNDRRRQMQGGAGRYCGTGCGLAKVAGISPIALSSTSLHQKPQTGVRRALPGGVVAVVSQHVV